jgi:hypothetical protein
MCGVVWRTNFERYNYFNLLRKITYVADHMTSDVFGTLCSTVTVGTR